jgi:hypothetical protein
MKPKQILSCFLFFAIAMFFACESPDTKKLVVEKSDVQGPDMEQKIKVQKSVAMHDRNFLATWDSLIPGPGDKAPDFTIHTKEGKPFNLYEELEAGKPILLVNGSYTCDLTQNSLPFINQFSEKYGDKISINLIYTVESHPIDAASPYSMDDKIWVKKQNEINNIESKQPVVYQDRVNNAFLWQKKFNIAPRILVDSPENTYWTTYGQSPNMVLLIKPNGEVYYRQIVFSGELLEMKIKELVDLG